jgi:hypothetical protein
MHCAQRIPSKIFIPLPPMSSSSSSSKGGTVVWRQVNLSLTSNGALEEDPDKLEQVQNLLQERWTYKQLKKFDKADECARELQGINVSYDDALKTWYFKAAADKNTNGATANGGAGARGPTSSLSIAERQRKKTKKQERNRRQAEKNRKKMKKDSDAAEAAEAEAAAAELPQKKARKSSSSSN